MPTDAHKRYGGMGTILVVKVGEFTHTHTLYFYHYFLLINIWYFSFLPPFEGFCRVSERVWRTSCWSNN